MQYTLVKPVSYQGISVHKGVNVTMRVYPAPANHGIVFRRVDAAEGQQTVEAKWDNVVDAQLCTVIANKHGVIVSTIEHFMSACAAFGIHNALIEIDGEEVPILDGSAIEFLNKLKSVGRVAQHLPETLIRVLKPVTVTENGVTASLKPYSASQFTCSIDFDHKMIGKQCVSFNMDTEDYENNIAKARTFGFLKDIEKLKSIGLARGGSLDNAIVLDEKKVLNPNGLRFEDEFVRHKLLDAIGDLYCAGGKIEGAYSAHRPSHKMNNVLLRALFSDATHYEIVEGTGSDQFVRLIQGLKVKT